MSEASQSLPDILRLVFESFLSGVAKASPGVIKSYDSSTQTCSVQPAIKNALPRRDGTFVLEDPPVLDSVPVLHPRAGAAWIHLPITAGDTVLLVYCDRDINEWRRLGGVVDAGDQRVHGIAGAVAIPGLFPSASPISAPDATALEFGIGAMKMRLKSTGLEIDDASDAAALASEVAILRNAVANHIHGGVTTGSGSTATGTFTTPPLPSAGAFASSQLKVGA